MSHDSRSDRPPSRPSKPHRKPEAKFGPYANGIGTAVWLNNVAGTDGATRKARAITIAPRRYYDQQSGQWRDSTSYYPSDIPALIYALQRAQEYLITTPMPDEEESPGPPDEVAY